MFMKNRFNSADELFEKWLDFREDELEHLTDEDKKHRANTDEYVNNIIEKIPKENLEYVVMQLQILGDKLAESYTYDKRKYYREGFKDCLNMVISSIK